jgi:hypothetical protein
VHEASDWRLETDLTPTRQQTNAVARFTCLGASCPDTCCKGWGMQLTQETVDTYRAQAPELLAAVTSGEAEFVMKRDEAGHCVKLDQGWCAIHRDYGASFLGDACHFYPRITRALGDVVFTGAALSGPEAARLMLFSEDAFGLTEREEMRLPFSLRNFLPRELQPGEAMAIHQQFIAEAGAPERTAERSLMHVSTVARALEMQETSQWPAAAELYFKLAAGRLPGPEAHSADPIRLLQGLQGLIVASKATHQPRLMQVTQRMAEALGATLDWEQPRLDLAPDAPERALRLLHFWRSEVATSMQPVLRRYLQAQFSLSLFPFGGLGANLSERITIIGARFATVKLALMSEAVLNAAVPDEAQIVFIVQGLSRLLDHLAEPDLSLAIYRETEWIREPRLRALIGDDH